ncbi:CrcB protein [Peptoniphilus asaccharolyticus DSM 20463]|uniref:Fluoride-specific ion channel FluC n=1 Tax=Peptoniphilus asaccharolyticus DSM 20463 TaxID=573058 RepID=A0A1W1UYM3_PEPAS|nr:fluoride efflux transporter CrcB [Peptoniphilus asaccharolyticus]SMB85841.1 CrcB protein [Peptoniphilus asaccharolyticus DSM 20463]
MIKCLIVGLGGFIGSILRYLIGLLPIGSKINFPLKTLIINIVGSFIIGTVVAIALKDKEVSEELALFLKVGICGGFTTFSSFAFESFDLFNKGEFIVVLSYILISVVFSILAIALSQYLIIR